MALPPLYKYLDVQGAKLTLGNRTFKHAKPSTFSSGVAVTMDAAAGPRRSTRQLCQRNRPTVTLHGLTERADTVQPAITHQG
jgi:hypothetical protein